MASELKMQAICFQWFHNTYPQYRKLLFRVKNEMDNHPYKQKSDIFKQLAENKATGVVDGAPDFMLLLRRTCCIELKVAGGRQSDAQKEFEAKATSMGHLYFVVWTFEEFKELVISLLEKYS